MHKQTWIQQKIFDDRDALARKCASMRAMGRKVVFTNGCFDILHRGHLDYLAHAASMGNALIVGVNTDHSVQRLKGPTRPLNNTADRAFALASLLCVDAVYAFDEDTPLELIKMVQPHVLAKGGDYTIDHIVGAAEVQASGGEVAIIPFVTGYSTTGFIDKIRTL